MEVINHLNSAIAAALSAGLLLLAGLCAHRERFLGAFMLLLLAMLCSFAPGLAPLLVMSAPGSAEYLQAAVGTIPPTIAAAALLWWFNQASVTVTIWYWLAVAIHAFAVKFWYF